MSTTTGKFLTIFVQSIFAVVILANVTSAQTATPAQPATVSSAIQSVETQSAETQTTSNPEVVKPAATAHAGLFSLEKLHDRFRLDSSTAKTQPAKASLIRKTSHSLSGTTELASESTEPQDPAPAAAPAKPASNGSNPVDLITRVEVKYQFQNFASGYLHGIPVLRGDYAFTHTVSIRMDLPILTFDAKTPGARSESGIGDIVTSMTFVKVLSKKFVGAFVPRIDFPTATHASLGSGKYVFKPLIAGVTPLGKGLGFVGILEYHGSFAGNKNRADINEVSIKPILLKSFLAGPLKGYYVNPKAEIIVDFEQDNNTTLQAGAEFGKALNKNVVVFAVPTLHVAGTKKESFKLEVGFRYLFR